MKSKGLIILFLVMILLYAAVTAVLLPLSFSIVHMGDDVAETEDAGEAAGKAIGFAVGAILLIVFLAVGGIIGYGVVTVLAIIGACRAKSLRAKGKAAAWQFFPFFVFCFLPAATEVGLFLLIKFL